MMTMLKSVFDSFKALQFVFEFQVFAKEDRLEFSILSISTN